MSKVVKAGKRDLHKSLEELRQRPHEAARIVDKNARTLAKINQLLEMAQRPGASEVDKDAVVMRYVEKLKARFDRRLAKLSRWCDLGYEERLPKLKKTDPRHYATGGSFVPPPPEQYINAVTFPGAHLAHLPTDPSDRSSDVGTMERGPLRDLTAPQLFTVKLSSLALYNELTSAALVKDRILYRLKPNGEKLEGFGEVPWKDYSHPANVNGYCCVFHENQFHIGPVTESHGAVIRVGAGDKGRVSLNKINYKSPPFEKPEGGVDEDGNAYTAKEAALSRVRELYEFLTTKGWPAIGQPPLNIPVEKLNRFQLIQGHPENMRGGIR
jgi:hypothetical protein